MKKIIKKICNELVNKYRNDDNVLGIALFGSAARGKINQYSDIDIYILLRQKGPYSRINSKKDNIRVDILLDSIKEAEEFLEEDRHNIKRNTSHMLAYARVLYQKGSDLDQIITKAKQNLTLPTHYTKSEILMHKYSIDDFWGEVQRDADNKDYIAFGLDSQLLINNIVELFLKLHGEFQGQPNEMYKTLSRLDNKFADKIDSFYKAGTIEARKEILGELVTYIFEKSQGPLPEKWIIE